LEHLSENPPIEYLIDRHLSVLTASLFQMCGVQRKPSDCFLMDRPPPQTELENTEEILAWMEGVNSASD
jgi:hypothetical protein